MAANARLMIVSPELDWKALFLSECQCTIEQSEDKLIRE